MGRPKYRDYGIRPKGSPELAFDPTVLIQIAGSSDEFEGEAERKQRRERSIEVFNFLIKTALKILPPKQREIFYSVWVRSGGRMNKGIMEFSRRTGRSHYTSYNNYYKSLASLQNYLKRTGYDVYIVEYLHGNIDSLTQDEGE